MVAKKKKPDRMRKFVREYYDTMTFLEIDLEAIAESENASQKEGLKSALKLARISIKAFLKWYAEVLLRKLKDYPLSEDRREALEETQEFIEKLRKHLS